MTRTAQVTQAVSAMRKARPAPSSRPEPASTAFLIDEDNGGRYHWSLFADGGEILVRSDGYGSYDEAEHAAGLVHRGASQATFEQRSGDSPSVDVFTRRDALSARDRLDAERWLDEGGSFSSAAVTR